MTSDVPILEQTEETTEKHFDTACLTSVKIGIAIE